MVAVGFTRCLPKDKHMDFVHAIEVLPMPEGLPMLLAPSSRFGGGFGRWFIKGTKGKEGDQGIKSSTRDDDADWPSLMLEVLTLIMHACLHSN